MGIHRGLLLLIFILLYFIFLCFRFLSVSREEAQVFSRRGGTM